MKVYPQKTHFLPKKTPQSYKPPPPKILTKKPPEFYQKTLHSLPTPPPPCRPYLDLRLLVITDSQYVYDGLNGAAFRWRAAGWVGQSGPMCNVDLWITLLDLVDTALPTIRWLRVPSHTDIPGNERADGLAEEGGVSSPLYHVLSLLEKPVVSLELPATPTPRRAPAVPRSLDINDLIAPSRDTLALCRTPIHTSCHDTEPILPKCLDFLDRDSEMMSIVQQSPLIARRPSIVSISSYDIASTVSFHESDVANNPEDMWMALGLIALETPAQSHLQRRLNNQSTEASSHHYGFDSDRLSYPSGCQTPNTDSN